jgi:hypothetical protein
MLAVPQLHELSFECGRRFGLSTSSMWLRSMRELHSLRIEIEIDLLPLSSLQLLPRLPALHTLDIGTSNLRLRLELAAGPDGSHRAASHFLLFVLSAVRR